MPVVDSPQSRPPTTGPDGETGRSAGGSRAAFLVRAARAPLVWSGVLCVALAAVSAAVLPTVPSYDPWSWIVWGREVSDPHLSFLVSGGPSWKPLPFVFTTVWGLFGGAAPTLWVITARAGGLLGLVFAWRLAHRLLGGGWAGALAGVLAVVGVVLTQDWVYYWLRGTSEVVLIAGSLGAVERLLARRRGQAFALAVAASLIRPEWWPFVILYAAWLWLRDPAWGSVKMRAVLLAGLLLIPILWFVPPYVASGQAFLAATHAAAYNGHLGPNRLRAVVGRAIDLQVLPALIAAVLAVGIGWWRERDRLLLAMGAAVVAWWVVVIGMTLDGYPGLERFFLPAAALICVLGGVGLVRLGLLAGGLLEGHRALLAVAVTAGLFAVSIPLTTQRFAQARAAGPAADTAVTTLKHLDAAVAAAGGHHGVFPCKTSFAAVNHGVQTALAWKLHVTLERVGTSMRAPGLDFIGPHNGTDGAPAPVDHRLTDHQTIATVDGWRVVRLTDPNHPELSTCAGR
ncbi:MAG: hypothetical protein QOF83_1098 [Solirubrobacteraceae bacterium]|jgi:hypothetical protein|nr:hypothetical protein [Solirubrobacteraceae bacterium]